MAFSKLLVVEGNDDLRVISSILKRHNFEPHFEIQDEGGYESLLKRLDRRLRLGTDVEQLGIVVDADENATSRWDSIRSVLEKAGYLGVSAGPELGGAVMTHGELPRLGVWVMPNNELPGMLEDYLACLVPVGDTLFERASQAIEGIPIDERRFIQNHQCKALIHTWLAWQEDPGTPLGLAITKKYFETEVPNVQNFLNWLTRLFA